MSKASKDSMERLHGAIADKLSDTIENMEAGDKGLAALLNVARQFLKDNGIDSVATETNPVGKVAEAVSKHPFDPAESLKHH
ncbi:hypothetical protein [Xanthomonas citri]|uniref:hypothetical protein n=1 Tax=Xanthomonas citri TaxID=346 RepID=UPI0004A7EFE5|nr:hypothetical protein [Xanthomonas citri]QDS19385.1 hypothetical protein FPL05_06085 [Xanthomonas citri pv. glycines]QTK40158.1 hypothetical protein XcgCFBP7119R_05580 [Xanthomonas citri pv. glycines]